MDQHIKKLWIAALKGEYADKKGRGALCQRRFGTLSDGDDLVYCCLGVLINVQGGETDTMPTVVTSTVPAKYAAGLSTTQQQDLAIINDENETWEPVIEAIEKL